MILFAWLGILIIVLVSIVLTLKFADKLKCLTTICIIFILASLFVFFGIRAFFSAYLGKLLAMIFLLLDTVCITILLVQFFSWLFTSASPQASVNPVERRRILKMVEDGKMTSDEAKELLDALGKSSALRGEEKFSRIDFMMLASVSLVILGFFLPWVYIRTSDRLDMLPDALGRARIYQPGYNSGIIGWSLFFIAIASAIPVFVTPRNFLYKITMLQIFLTIIGIILAISLIIRTGDQMGAGLILCLIGFILALAASAAKLKSLAA